MSERQCAHGRSFQESCETCREEVRAFKHRQHCPGCSGYLPRSEGPKIEDILGISPCPGLPASGLRILPPRPPNVAALLDEDARLPAAEVGAVVEALFSHRAAKVHLQSLGDPVSPVLDFAERIKSCQNVMDAWDRVEKALDALAALGRKES